MDGEPVKTSSHSGILVHAAPGLAECVAGAPTDRRFVAGRIASKGWYGPLRRG